MALLRDGRLGSDTSNNAISEGVDMLSDLAAIEASGRYPLMVIFVASEESMYYWDEASVLAPAPPSVVKPDDITLPDAGRWIAFGGGGGGYTPPQEPDTTGAFAAYRMQDAFGSLVIRDSIGVRHLTGVNAPNIAPHPLYPSRQIMKPLAGNYVSPFDAAWAGSGTDQTIEAIVYPYKAAGGIWWQMQSATQATFTCVQDVAQNRISVQWNGAALYTATGKRFPMGGDSSGVNPISLPYLIRFERENIAGTQNVRVYFNGEPWDLITSAVAPPNTADRFLVGNSPNCWFSDLIVWQTPNPPVTAADQARRVFPWLIV